jgi:hypothetical protein
VGTNFCGNRVDKTKKAATLVMLQPSAPAREQNSPDACTVAALDAITAFAVPNPNCPSQSRRFFQVWQSTGSPRLLDHPAYFGLAKVYFGPTLSAVDGSEGKREVKKCQCRISVQRVDKTVVISYLATA